MSYTWSHNFADFVDNLTGGSTPANAYNYSLERSNSPFDVRHKFVANAVWNVPVGKGGVLLNNDGLASRLLGGWQMNTIVTLQTGLPFTVTSVDNSATGSRHQNRANLIGDPYAGRTTDHSLYAGTRAPGLLNPAAFATPALGTFGNAAPRGFAGPGMQDVDLSIFKVFAIREDSEAGVPGGSVQRVQPPGIQQSKRQHHGGGARLVWKSHEHGDGSAVSISSP
ncbi:MAG: hypothetical protein QM757_47220 [Paludibaculum sp.]